MSNTAPTARGPLAGRFRSVGARTRVDGAWELAAEFDGVAVELERARTRVAVADLSHLSKWEVLGPGTREHCRAMVARALGGSADRVHPGHTFIVPSDANGSTAGPGPLLYAWLAEDQAIILSLATGDSAMVSKPDSPTPSEQEAGLQRVRFLDATGRFAVMELVGPNGEQVLRGLTTVDVLPRSFGLGRCLQTGVARIPVTLVRPPQSPHDHPSPLPLSPRGEGRGVDGARCEVIDERGVAALKTPVPQIQLWCTRDYGQYLWQTLLEAARPFGGGPLGWNAWNKLRQDVA